ncbi:DUF1496 domain-containing protein [Psychromonas aquimarina]|uniref:DUF1496 domain-containing protein n=1 Tax=Psychromonas aquimarina TaxID=444919 RepID=UPI00041D186C|nr:DUF1496 domain-containing protein [Psychromonas aquimarina]
MNQVKSIANVGAQVPEMKNSPIVDDTDEEFDVLRQEVEELPCCYFNDISYTDGSYVHSGTDVLVCSKGLWIYQSSSDIDKP